MTDLYDETDYFGTPESRDREARLVGHEVKADTSEEAIVEVLDAMDRTLRVMIATLKVERDALKAENQRLREALTFYATEDVSFPGIGTVPFAGGDDGGKRARAALKGDKT
jgi:hypothetical protein